MVNWIHLIEPAILRPALASYFNAHLQPGGELVVDTIADPAYTYNHDVHTLAPRECDDSPPRALPSQSGRLGTGKIIRSL